MVLPGHFAWPCCAAFAVQQWLSPFFFGATFVMMLLFLVNAASGVTFYVLKKEKAWLTAAFLCWNAAALFLRCMAFPYRQGACYERSEH